MYCSGCGTELRDDARFCDSCGRTIAAPAPAREDAFGRQAGIEPEPNSIYQQRRSSGEASQPDRESLGRNAWISGICAVLALGILPPLLGGIAIYLAFKVRKFDEEKGNMLLALAGVCTVIGMIIGAATLGGGLFK